jgi:hypothetical protein
MREFYTSTHSAVNHPLESLRRRAERIVEERHDPDKPMNRRPSWAPALALDGEFLDILIKLQRLKSTDKPVARLWAIFQDPKRFGAKIRDEYSENPLHGIVCRGFELFAREERGGTRKVLFVSEKRADGTWDTRADPPAFWGTPPWSWMRSRTVEQQWDYYRLRQRSRELATARVLEFAGAPDIQMWEGAQLTGNCGICGATLEDPISLERGIGTTCFARLEAHDRRVTEASFRWESLEAEIAQLKADLFKTHPDHGGTSEGFRAVFARYEAAKARRNAP